MVAPTVYRWDDGNAPVARGERRSLVDILRACLVDGYGTKAAAGWTLEYINATFDKAAFRNNPVTGTGFYLQVDGLGATYAYAPNVQGFEAMTSESDGLFPFNTGAAYSEQMSASAGTTARPWVLVADDRAFWFICWPNNIAAPAITDSLNAGLFFGDIVKWKIDDAYACLLMTSQDYYGPHVAGTAPSTATGTRKNMPRKSSGAVGSAYSAAMVRGGGPGSDLYPGSGGMAYTAGDPVLITRPHLNDGAAHTLRGWVPGLYHPCHNLAFGQLATVTQDGASFLSIRGYMDASAGLGNWFIGLGDWRA